MIQASFFYVQKTVKHAERVIYFARIYFVLPEYLSVLKWILLGIVAVCILLYYKLSK